MLAGFTQAALDLVFPALCPLCQTTLGADRRDPLCGPCWQAITRLGRPRCHVCGAAPPLASDRRRRERAGLRRGGRARRAEADPPPYDYARSAAIFEGTLREALHAFKFSGKRALARPLGDLAAEHCVATLAEEIEAVVPVPLAPGAGARARLQSGGICSRRRVRAAARACRPGRAELARVRTTRPQSDLAASERRANVRGAFRASPEVSGRHVLVVDDVLTTGATLGECARALRDGGARRVGVLTVARVPHPAV